MTKPFSLEYSELRKGIYEALRAWQHLDGNPDTLLPELVLVQEQRRALTDTSPSAFRLATNQVLLDLIKELEKHDQMGARILTMRFVDNDIIQKVANKLYLSTDQVKRQQRAAIDFLTHLLLASEAAARNLRAQTLEAHLIPSTYSSLFGVEALAQTLYNGLISPDSPYVLAIVGMGGIGKTSLADMVVRQVIHAFKYEQIVWLRINSPNRIESDAPSVTLEHLITQLAQQICPHVPSGTSSETLRVHVRQTLKAIPYLIVVDNLELEADAAFLVPLLNDLANPSKFLLTTRTQAPVQVGVFNLLLNELPAAEAAKLVRHHARSINLNDLAEATLDQIQPIYNVVGGNPLALKLVVSLSAVHALPDVLKDLVSVRSDQIENLYRHIYWHAWNTLSQESRQLLEVMPLASGVGIVPEQMLAISGLSQKQVWPAINELVNRSLLEVGGSTWERRYSLHRLTETFLRTEIIHWPEDTGSNL